MTLLLNKVDDEIERHFSELGLGSVAAYKLWCYRNGLSGDLEKSEGDRQAEIDLHKGQTEPEDEGVSRLHNPRRAHWITRIFQGEHQDETLTDLLFRIRTMYNNLEEEESSRQALCRLLLHVEKYGDLMRPARASGCFGDLITNTYLAGMEQLARNHADWIRRPEDWRSDANKPWRQFSSLIRHLLAAYDVPMCLDNAFLQGTSDEARTQQQWFKHIGSGQNIRTAGVPMRITRRMAHSFGQFSHRHFTVYQALRKVQYESFGGSWKNSWAFADGPLAEKLEHEAFWETVVQYLANQVFLDGSYINPLIDYIRNQKFTPQRVLQPDGTEVEGPPPHPSFCMKGRSINKLLREVDTWHEELTGMEDVPFEEWKSAGFREFEREAFDSEMKRNLQWTVHELTTSAQLHVEARLMHHCVGSYTKRCASGELSVWSLRAIDLDADEENQTQEHVLTIAVDNKKRVVNQYAGKYNLKPFGKKQVSRKRNTGNVYLHLLRQSPTFMRMWMDREGLAYG